MSQQVRWQRVNDEPFEYAIQQGPHGDEFVKLLDGSCLRRAVSAFQTIANAKGSSFLDSRIWTRPEPNGTFDELFASACDIHIEMMDSNEFWMAIRYPDQENEVHVAVSAMGKLRVAVNAA